MNTCNIGLGLAALGRPEYINIRTKDTIDKSQFLKDTKHSEESDKKTTKESLDKSTKIEQLEQAALPPLSQLQI